MMERFLTSSFLVDVLVLVGQEEISSTSRVKGTAESRRSIIFSGDADVKQEGVGGESSFRIVSIWLDGKKRLHLVLLGGMTSSSIWLLVVRNSKWISNNNSWCARG
jgi:hypothetical protein